MKKSDFKHVVFTNFGVGIFDVNWLAYRLELFKLTTLKSLSSQTNKNFDWYIFVHKDMPKVILNLLGESLHGIGVRVFLTPVESYDLIQGEITNIKSKISSEFLISSRIDDDDLVYVDAVRDIQRKFTAKEKDFSLISLNNGADYLPEDNVAVKRDSESIAIMLSLISIRLENGGYHSINEFAHHMVIDTLAKFKIDCEYCPIESDKPLYFYIKHPLSDSFYAGARARMLRSSSKFEPKESDFKRFGVNIDIVNSLRDIAVFMPNGMPYKYLQKLNELRKSGKVGDDLASKISLFNLKKMSSVATRDRPWLKSRGKIRLAILGSCVSRDLFEAIPELKDRFDICFYNARSNLLSYVSPPVVCGGLKLPSDTFEERRANYDVSKSHWKELKASNPDIIMVDFIDERIGCIGYDGTWVSASGPIVKSLERSGKEFEIARPWSEHIVKLREWAVHEFMQKLTSISDNIIVHKASWAKDKVFEGKVIPVEDKWKTLTDLNNNILDGIFRIVEDNYPMVDFIGGSEIGMLSGGSHFWEYSPFHYDVSYYKSLSSQLNFRIY